MHHRRKPTSRREVRRIDTKRERAAVRSVIDGDTRSRVVRSGGWAHRPTQPPIIDEVPKGHLKRRNKKVRVKRHVCTQPHHEFLKDIGVFEYPRYSWEEYDWETHTEIRRYRMCVHCGLIQCKSRSRWGSPWYVSGKSLVRSANEQERSRV